MEQTSQRENWGSKLGFILAATGSAVGLGNIWKFPYMAGSNGGGAFVLLYLSFVIIIGFTLTLGEFAVGRRKQKATVGAIKAYDKRFSFAGILGFMVCFFVMGYFPVIGGWALAYIPKVLGGFLSTDPAGYQGAFDSFIANPTVPIIWLAIYLVVNLTIVLKGIQSGIEKASKIFMPALALILVVITIRGLTLPGAMAGLEFLFKPDFSTIDGGVAAKALGQAFFSIGIGFGTMSTYGSYIRKDDSLVSNAGWVVGLDTGMAILAGIALFPALFAYGQDPAGGFGLVFTVMPTVFAGMGGFGIILAVLFFIGLFVAAITSSIGLQEVVVSYLIEEKNISRKKATLGSSVIMVVMCIFASLSMGGVGPKLFGVGAFDVYDFFSSGMFIALAGLFVAVFASWRMGKEELLDEITNSGKKPFALFDTWFFALKYILPLIIVYVLIWNIKSLYDTGYIGLFITSIGVILASVVFSKKF